MVKEKIRFIVNPYSGTSKKGNLNDLITKYLDHEKYEYEIFFTEGPGHGTVLAQEAIQKGIDVVAAVGGDGTINEISHVLYGTETALGVLPGGSGNGFSMHLGIGRSMKKGFKILNSGRKIKIDTCRINDDFFVNVAGLGFDAKVAYDTKENKKRGFYQYLVSTIRESRKYKAHNMLINIDGKEIEGKYLTAVIANASMYGYYFTIAPNAHLDDGVLDLILFKDVSRSKYFFQIHRFLNKSIHKSSITETFKGKEISIQVKEPIHYHVDGEGRDPAIEFYSHIEPNSLIIIGPKEES